MLELWSGLATPRIAMRRPSHASDCQAWLFKTCGCSYVDCVGGKIEKTQTKYPLREARTITVAACDKNIGCKVRVRWIITFCTYLHFFQSPESRANPRLSLFALFFALLFDSHLPIKSQIINFCTFFCIVF